MKRYSPPFERRRHAPGVILPCAGWHRRCQLSCRGPGEMMSARGLSVGRTTARRRARRSAPDIKKRARPHPRMGGASDRLDETCVEVGAGWGYSHRAAAPTGQAIAFMLSARRDVPAAGRPFRGLMRAGRGGAAVHHRHGRARPLPGSTPASAGEKALPFDCEPRRVEYLDDVIERDRRAIRRGWRAMQGPRPFHTAGRAVGGVEATHMVRAGRVKRLDGSDSAGQAKFAASLFDVAA